MPRALAGAQAPAQEIGLGLGFGVSGWKFSIWKAYVSLHLLLLLIVSLLLVKVVITGVISKYIQTA